MRPSRWAAAALLCWCAAAVGAPPAASPPAPPRRQRQRAPRPPYCASGEPAARAFFAPTLFEGKVRSAGSDRRANYSATFEVKRVYKNQKGGRPLFAGDGLRLRLSGPRSAPPPDCPPYDPLRGGPRWPDGPPRASLRPGKTYIVFVERDRHHNYAALGPPILRSKKNLRQIRDVFSPSYPRAASVVQGPQAARVRAGTRLRLTCQARARPRPSVVWYRDGRPVSQLHIRRIRVHHYRRRSVLVIPHVRREDSARYECRAQGAVGRPASAAANVSVIGEIQDNTTWGAPCPMPDPSSYCLNGGTCLFFEAVREAACKCPEGFNGQRCENKDVTNRSSMYHSYTCKLGLSTSYYC